VPLATARGSGQQDRGRPTTMVAHGRLTCLLWAAPQPLARSHAV